MWRPYTPSAPPRPSLFLLVYKSKRLLVARPTSYDACLASTRQHFPEIPLNHNITFHTTDVDVCDGQLAEIPKNTWDIILPLLKSVTIKSEGPSIEQTSDGSDCHYTDSKEIEISILHKGSNNSFAIFVTPSTIMTEVFAAAESHFNTQEVDLYTSDLGISKTDTVEMLGLKNGDVIECMPVVLCRKPVIYLYSPSENFASVTLSLIRQWKFSVVYPVVPIKRVEGHLHEELEWKVRVCANGQLTEMNTGLDVAYLFWEARTDPSIPISPPQSPIIGHPSSDVEVFNPNDACLSDNDSVVISVDIVTPYLDTALKALGLHTEARTSFITYWLPEMLKHKHIALRFVPQSTYERAAPLKISPAPDIITRVFMLFKGVDEGLLSDWPLARDRAHRSADFWKDVVGVNYERSMDESLFRALEWGGMEVRH
ncbi:hypothetical protein K443DRAFT_135456 [Laccaria amethystina LaAM-08-1]|uniref:Unplaced genomic scaffold K443scaffold_444, whole genome shotgun sequence n=1 Tax=Laccaria amethystina LaAM-08-1 TaxID=1095629 RepID=A0A0C9WN70_9AGAR|nr:hypothetical protein K443DRAFT_135456 [Laccaria amethystina LaAM-08-1]